MRGVKVLDVYGDSFLVIYQINGRYQTKDEKLIPYHNHLEELIKEFDEVTFRFVTREKKKFADALVTLAAWLLVPESGTSKMVIEKREQPAYCYALEP